MNDTLAITSLAGLAYGVSKFAVLSGTRLDSRYYLDGILRDVLFQEAHLKISAIVGRNEIVRTKFLAFQPNSAEFSTPSHLFSPCLIRSETMADVSAYQNRFSSLLFVF